MKEPMNNKMNEQPEQPNSQDKPFKVQGLDFRTDEWLDICPTCSSEEAVTQLEALTKFHVERKTNLWAGFRVVHERPVSTVEQQVWLGNPRAEPLPKISVSWLVKGQRPSKEWVTLQRCSSDLEAQTSLVNRMKAQTRVQLDELGTPRAETTSRPEWVSMRVDRETSITARGNVKGVS